MAKSNKGESDWWSLQAKKLGYPARSVFKLKQIDEKFHIFKGAKKVLDIGAAPGSWTLFVSREILKGEGKVVACDLNPLSIGMECKNIMEITGDAFCQENIEKIVSFANYDVVISDAAPHTTGNRNIDCQRSLDIAQSVVSMANDVLKKGGNAIFKAYQSNEINDFVKTLKDKYSKISIFKPECCRSTSFEFYVILQNKK